uniref:Uncharacterized protein n=1 Tax=Parascaris univalens TaxID=6257 RepID=A0A915CHD3_PARUN
SGVKLHKNPSHNVAVCASVRVCRLSLSLLGATSYVNPLHFIMKKEIS